MDLSLPASSPLLGAVLIAGIAVGWLLAKFTGNRKTVHLSSLPAGMGLETGTHRVTKTRTIELKCKCGSVLKFRDPVAPGYQPYLKR